ncbi:MAG: hypothetical protein U1F42_09330 [Candidatus Competibacteraceae bacterium]
MQQITTPIRQFWILALVILLCGPITVQGSNTVPAEMLQVWQAFRQAVTAGDSKQVAALSQFPIAANDFGGPIKSPAVLHKRFQTIFRPEIVACFANAEPKAVANFPGYLVECQNALAFGFKQYKGKYRFSYIDNANAE